MGKDDFAESKFILMKELIRRHDLSDREFSTLLKYALKHGDKYKAAVYRKIIDEAARAGYTENILSKMKCKIKNLHWVHRICNELLEHQDAIGDR